MDPNNPFGVVSTAVIFDNKMKEDIRKRVDKLHSKISRLKQQRKSLTEQNKELLQKVFQLETEQLYSSTTNNKDEMWMNNIRHSMNSNASRPSTGFDPNALGQQSAEVQQMMKGYVEAMQKLEVKFMELEEGTKDEDMGAGFKRKYKMFTKWIDHNLPFSDDIQWAFLHYGVGISSFFSFYRFVVFNSWIMLVSYSYFLIKQVLDYNQGDESFSELFSYGLPKFTMFSKVGVNDTGDSLANIYASAIIAMMVCMTYSSFHKWISENRKGIVNRLLTTNTATNKFASLSFQCWDFSKTSKAQVYEQKHSVAEEFRLLLQDEQLANVKQSRTKKEKYLLYARRTLGVFLNSLFVFGSWWAIFTIVSTQQDVIDQLTETFGATAASAIHPAGSIILVGLILPTVTFAITSFEHWDSDILTMKNQIWRLFFGRLANVIVAGIPPYFIYEVLQENPSFMAKTLKDPVDALTQKENDEYGIFKDDKYLCFEDLAAYYLIKLVLTDFFLPKGIKIGMWMAKEFVNRFKSMPHAPYNVAESIIEILYTQGLLWFTMPFYPFLAFLAPIMMIANFKFEKYVVSKFRGKMDASWKAEETGSFFIIFYNLTLLIGLTANYMFLQTEWPGYARISSTELTILADSSTKQGPFREIDPSQPWNAVELWMVDKGLESVLHIFDNAMLFMALAAILTLKLALVGNVVEAKSELLEVKDHEIAELYKKLWTQKKRLELQMNKSLQIKKDSNNK